MNSQELQAWKDLPSWNYGVSGVSGVSGQGMHIQIKMNAKKKNIDRLNRLAPNGIPKWVRIYDNEGETADRYTVVFTGNYNNISRYRYSIYYPSYYYIGMDGSPFSPQGFCQHMESSHIVDAVSGRWGGVKIGQNHPTLGKRIRFEDLNYDCQKVVIEDYIAVWNLQEVEGVPTPPPGNSSSPRFLSIPGTSSASSNEIKVHVAIITHQYGSNVYLGITKEQLQNKVYNYVKQYWKQEMGEEIPEGKSEAIELYFDKCKEMGDEFIQYDEEMISLEDGDSI